MFFAVFERLEITFRGTLYLTKISDKNSLGLMTSVATSKVSITIPNLMVGTANFILPNSGFSEFKKDNGCERIPKLTLLCINAATSAMVKMGSIFLIILMSRSKILRKKNSYRPKGKIAGQSLTGINQRLGYARLTQF